MPWQCGVHVVCCMHFRIHLRKQNVFEVVTPLRVFYVQVTASALFSIIVLSVPCDKTSVSNVCCCKSNMHLFVGVCTIYLCWDITHTKGTVHLHCGRALLVCVGQF